MADIYKVVVTDDAKNNLREIIEYLGKNASYEVAEKVRDGIEEEIAKLAEIPQSKGLLRGVQAKKFVYRRILKWSYRIIFTIVETELIVLVVRIDHAKNDPSKLENLP